MFTLLVANKLKYLPIFYIYNPNLNNFTKKHYNKYKMSIENNNIDHQSSLSSSVIIKWPHKNTFLRWSTLLNLLVRNLSVHIWTHITIYHLLVINCNHNYIEKYNNKMWYDRKLSKAVTLIDLRAIYDKNYLTKKLINKYYIYSYNII